MLEEYIRLQVYTMFRWCKMYNRTWKDWVLLESSKFRRKHMNMLIYPGNPKVVH